MDIVIHVTNEDMHYIANNRKDNPVNEYLHNCIYTLQLHRAAVKIQRLWKSRRNAV